MIANRIMIVEDDKGISDALALNMQFVGYDYMIFSDGRQAADYLFEDHAFDLALLDIMLPGIDGFELFGHMEKYSIPVIYMTAKTDSASEIKGLRDGAEDYIVKPFETVTLMVRIEKVLRRTGKLNTVYRIKDIEVNSENRTVKKAGELIDLQPMELDVLLMLLKNKNMTVSRERLLAEIWGYDFVGETRVVDVKIFGLRKKLDLGEQIKSIPKLGYRLEER
ncbi:MAG: response regulator transcription factor [Christensenellales bacterium]|jgi:two-component system alkaline phosphatase synthesis response regulator PhoP